MNYKIVGDSCCDVTDEMRERYNVSLAPLTFTLDGIEYVDDDNLDLNHYLDMVDKSKNTPKSACPSIQDYLGHFEEGNHDWVFGITISAELSGSYNSAMNAREMYLEKYPDKKCHVFNSTGASTYEVLIVLKIAELCEAGKSFEEVVSEVDAFIEDAKLFFVLDKIDTLEKNGRLSFIKARIVKALNLKLILMANQEGVIDMIDKARGNKKALKKMVEKMADYGTISKDKILAISHCDAPERAEYVKELAESMYDFKDIIILKMKGLSSTYANVGGIIITY